MQFPTWKCDFEFYVNYFPVKNLIITVIWTARMTVPCYGNILKFHGHVVINIFPEGTLSFTRG